MDVDEPAESKRRCSVPRIENDEEFKDIIDVLKRGVATRYSANYVAEIIAHYIYHKDYESALGQYKNYNASSVELDRMKLFLEIHMVNVDRRMCETTDSYLIDNYLPPRRNAGNVAVEESAKMNGMSEVLINGSQQTHGDAQTVDIGKILCSDTLDVRRRTKFVLDNKAAVHRSFVSLSKTVQQKYIRQIIALTEDKMLQFLKKRFDFDVLQFLRIYVKKRQRHVRGNDKERLSFMLNEKYYRGLMYRDLLAIYEIHRDNKVFMQAMYRNPFVSASSISREIRSRLLDDSTYKQVKACAIKILEVRYIGGLYELARKYDYRSRLMNDVRKSATKGRCVFRHRKLWKEHGHAKVKIEKMW